MKCQDLSPAAIAEAGAAHGAGNDSVEVGRRFSLPKNLLVAPEAHMRALQHQPRAQRNRA
jgi:hypothetical protein